jgi:glycosyltransferase involved in cell wall biosynthesis
MSKMISVVIPALNEERMIGQCLKQFEDQPGVCDIINYGPYFKKNRVTLLPVLR